MVQKFEGKDYWCVKLSKPIIDKETEIYIKADNIYFEDDFIIFGKDTKEGLRKTFITFHKDFVACFFRASLMDGSAIDVEHWTGEID